MARLLLTILLGCWASLAGAQPSFAQRLSVDDSALATGDNPVLSGPFCERWRGIILGATLRVDRESERRTPAVRPAHCTLDLTARLTDQARREGIAIAAGTDGETARDNGFLAFSGEWELLVAPGYLANLVVLERDPLADIANLRSVLFTARRGRRFDRSDFRPISAEEMPDAR